MGCIREIQFAVRESRCKLFLCVNLLGDPESEL